METRPDGANNGSLDLLEKRIKYLSAAAVKLATIVPSVSHSLMRLAQCHLKDAKGTIPRDQNLHLCFSCGAVRTYCINTKIRCEKSTPLQRKKCRKSHTKKKNKGLDTNIISHKNVMIYQCKLCNARIILPGEPRILPSSKKQTTAFK